MTTPTAAPRLSRTRQQELEHTLARWEADARAQIAAFAERVAADPFDATRAGAIDALFQARGRVIAIVEARAALATTEEASCTDGQPGLYVARRRFEADVIDAARNGVATSSSAATNAQRQCTITAKADILTEIRGLMSLADSTFAPA